MKNTITHEEIKSAFSEIYNSFYLNHRLKENRPRTEEEWAYLINDAAAIRKKYNSELVTKIVNALLDEFESQHKSCSQQLRDTCSLAERE